MLVAQYRQFRRAPDGFIVTNLNLSTESGLLLHSTGHGGAMDYAEQGGHPLDPAVPQTILQVSRQSYALARNFVNFIRTLTLLQEIKPWRPYPRYTVVQLAKIAVAVKLSAIVTFAAYNKTSGFGPAGRSRSSGETRIKKAERISMSKNPISTMPEPGHVNPRLPLAAELIHRGSVRWHTGSVMRDRVEAIGAIIEPFEDTVDMRELRVEPDPGTKGLAAGISMMRPLLMIRIAGQVADYRKIPAEPADLLHVDMNCFGAHTLHDLGRPPTGAVRIDPVVQAPGKPVDAGQPLPKGGISGSNVVRVLTVYPPIRPSPEERLSPGNAHARPRLPPRNSVNPPYRLLTCVLSLLRLTPAIGNSLYTVH